MNSIIDREIVAQAVIAVAVCAGAWLMLVQPRAQETDRLEAHLASSTASVDLATHESVEAMAARVRGFKARLDEVRARNLVAEDTSALYATIMRKAAELGVRVQSLQPAPLKEVAKNSPVRTARLEMTVEGHYDDVARFLDRVADINAFIRATSLQVTPVDRSEPGQVSARFGCDVLAFAIDGALAGVGGQINAQP